MFAAALCASLALTAAASDDQPRVLYVGDPAPKLQIKDFVRGEPIKQIEPGKFYVITFWPDNSWDLAHLGHLITLQRKHKDAVFLFVASDHNLKMVKSLAAKRAGKLDFRLAAEAVGNRGGVMSSAWLVGRGWTGSTAFVVNRAGKIAWIGNPQDLEEPLELILADKWDLAEKAAQDNESIADQKKLYAEMNAEEGAREKRMGRLFDSLNAAIRAKRYEDALRIADEAEGDAIILTEDADIIRLSLLSISGKDPSKAEKLAEDILRETYDGAPGPWTVFLAIVAPDLILSEERLSSLEKDRLPQDIRVVPALKLDHALAEVAALAADAVNENVEADAEAAKERTRDSVPERATNRIVLANSSLLMARAYQAAGEKEKARRELKKATDALRRTARDANEALDKARTMEKELGTP